MKAREIFEQWPRRLVRVLGRNRYGEDRVDELDLSSFDLTGRGFHEEGAFRVKVISGHYAGQTGYAQPGHYSEYTFIYSDGTKETVTPAELMTKFPRLRRYWNRFKQRPVKEIVGSMLR